MTRWGALWIFLTLLLLAVAAIIVVSNPNTY